MKARKLKAAIKAAGADVLDTLWVLFCIFSIFVGVVTVVGGLAFAMTTYPALSALGVIIVAVLGFAIGAGIQAYKEAE